MLEILQFVFQDFWHWIGTAILILCLPAFIKVRVDHKTSSGGGKDGDKAGAQKERT